MNTRQAAKERLRRTPLTIWSWEYLGPLSAQTLELMQTLQPKAESQEDSFLLEHLGGIPPCWEAISTFLQCMFTEDTACLCVPAQKGPCCTGSRQLLLPLSSSMGPLGLQLNPESYAGGKCPIGVRGHLTSLHNTPAAAFTVPAVYASSVSAGK